jgi:hypothetical protein
MIHGMMETNLLEVPSAPQVKIPILVHEIAHAKTFPSPGTKTLIQRMVHFACTFQPISWKNGIVIVFLAMDSVGGEQIDRADAIFVSLRKIELFISVIIQTMLEKQATTNDFVLSVDLTRFS